MKETTTEIQTAPAPIEHRKRLSLAMAEGDLNMLISMVEDVGVADESGQVAITKEQFLEAFGGSLEVAQDARDRAARFRHYAKSYCEAMKAEEEVLRAKRKRMEEGLARVDEGIIGIIVGRGVDEDGKCLHKLEGKVYKIRAQKNPDSVEVFDIDQLPTNMVRLNCSTFKPGLFEIETAIACLGIVLEDPADSDEQNAIHLNYAIDFLRSILRAGKPEEAKSLIAEALKTGEAVPGAKWSPISYHVRVS